jgi:DNA invertase Pin-like site-specific DNA recombinase
MIYGYKRISKRELVCDRNNPDAVQNDFILHGVLEENIYWDSYRDSFSGRNIARPNFDQLLRILQAGDILVVTKLDCFGRSIAQVINLINALVNKGISIDIVNIGLIDNSTSLLIWNIFLAMAQFERDILAERKEIGKIKEGFKEGRPKVYTIDQLNHAMHLLEKYDYKQVEEITKISITTLRRENRKRQ